MNILGINAFQPGASAAVLVNGQLVAAEQEHRFYGVELWTGFPEKSIVAVLEEAQLTVRDIDHVAVAFNPNAKKHARFFHHLWHWQGANASAPRLRQQRLESFKRYLATACGVSESEIPAEVQFVEHQDAHISGGYAVSPFLHAAILCIDGMGDFVSTVLASGNGEVIKRHREVGYPHSLGYFCAGIADQLGLNGSTEQRSLMDLAATGKPDCVDRIREFVRPTKRAFELNLEFFSDYLASGDFSSRERALVGQILSPKAISLLGKRRLPHEDFTDRQRSIAASTQQVTEEIVHHLLGQLRELTGEKNLVVVGEVAKNAALIGGLRAATSFHRVFVPPAPDDAGLSVGAAFHTWSQTLRRRRVFQIEHPYWGTTLRQSLIRTEVRRHLEAYEQSIAALPHVKTRIKSREYHQLADGIPAVAAALAAGKLVAWHQERTAFSTEPLGDRCVLVDPRRTDARSLLNTKFALGDPHESLAVSVLEAEASRYFDSDERSPFMERTLIALPAAAGTIPAVMRPDGTVLALTMRSDESALSRLLVEFQHQTGMPMLAMVPFVDSDEIATVNSPADGMLRFLRSSLDLLVIGKTIIEREPIERNVRIDAHPATGLEMKTDFIGTQATTPDATT